MITCSTSCAVDLLWGLGLAGALSYELWDVLSAPLDSLSDHLQGPQLLRIFEAYCLAVLRNSGPSPCEILMPQLVPAGHAFCQAVLGPIGAGRQALAGALRAAGLLAGDAGEVQLQHGHMVLFDAFNPGGWGGSGTSFGKQSSPKSPSARQYWKSAGIIG
jgi:hypothetical protein